MKKLFVALVMISLSGCALIDAYFMAGYDNVEYALVNKVRTLAQLSIDDCKDQKKSYANFEGMYWTSVELKNFSELIDRNEESFKMGKNLVELTKQGKEMYEKSTGVSETFCKLKLNQIERSAKIAQDVMGRKPR